MPLFDARLRITSRPHLARLADGFGGGSIYFRLDRHLEAVGAIAFDHPGRSFPGWRIGFVQAQWTETNWAVYRGETQAAGSVFEQRGKPPARTRQACRDGPAPGALFYGRPQDGIRTPVGGISSIPFLASLPANPLHPSIVEVLHSDMPSDKYGVVRRNGVTGQFNILKQVQLEFAFCTMFVAVDPAGQVHFLKGFYWNVNWQADFVTTPKTIIPRAVAGGNSCHVGAIFEGAPDDPRFLDMLTKPQPTTCNLVAQAAARNPALQEVTGWPTFDVRR